MYLSSDMNFKEVYKRFTGCSFPESLGRLFEIESKGGVRVYNVNEFGGGRVFSPYLPIGFVPIMVSEGGGRWGFFHSSQVSYPVFCSFGPGGALIPLALSDKEILKIPLLKEEKAFALNSKNDVPIDLKIGVSSDLEEECLKPWSCDLFRPYYNGWPLEEVIPRFDAILGHLFVDSNGSVAHDCFQSPRDLLTYRRWLEFGDSLVGRNRKTDALSAYRNAHSVIDVAGIHGFPNGDSPDMGDLLCDLFSRLNDICEVGDSFERQIIPYVNRTFYIDS